MVREKLNKAEYRLLECNKVQFETYIAVYGMDEPNTKSESIILSQTGRYSIFFLPLIAPWSIPARAWHLLIIALDMLYTAFIFPVTLAWKLGGQDLLTFEFTVACIFLLDVFIKLHTPYLARYKNEKILVTKGKDIFWIYLTRDTLVTDFVSAITFFIITLMFLTPIKPQPWLSYLRTIRIVRLWNVVLLVKGLFVGTWVQFFLSSPVSSLISTGGALALSMLYCAAVIVNLLGCCWWAVGNYNSYPPDETWQYHVSGLSYLPDGVYQMGISEQYVVSVYYIVTTLTTTGYGDIIPCNTTEMAWSMITMIVAALFFAFIVGSFVRTMMDSGAEAKRSQRFKDKSEAVELFLTTSGISRKLSREVYRYYSDIWLRQQEEVAMWEAIQDLGPNLKTKVIAEIVSPYLRVLAPLADLSDESILQISSILDPRPLAPEEELCRQGDEALFCWLLVEGAVTSIRGGRDMKQQTWAPGFLGAASLKALEVSDRAIQYKAGIKTVHSCLVFSMKVSNLKALFDVKGLSQDLATLRASLITTAKLDNDGILGSDTRRPIIIQKKNITELSRKLSTRVVSKRKSISISHLITPEDSRHLRSYAIQDMMRESARLSRNSEPDSHHVHEANISTLQSAPDQSASFESAESSDPDPEVGLVMRGNYN